MPALDHAVRRALGAVRDGRRGRGWSERLRAAGCAEPATLVCAPAGSGKTALVAAAARGRRRARRLGLAGARADDDPGRLWDAVLTALDAGRRRPRGFAAGRPRPAGARSRAPRSCRVLVNALAELPEPVDARARRRARAALARVPGAALVPRSCTRRTPCGSCSLARADPALPLHVLRVRGRLVEIRAADLAFTLPETAAVLAAHGVALGRRARGAHCTPAPRAGAPGCGWPR